MMKKNLKDSAVIGVTSTTKIKEDLKPNSVKNGYAEVKIDYQNTVLTNPDDIIFALKKNVKSFSLKELCDEAREESLNPIVYARLVGGTHFNEIYILNFYDHYPKRNMCQAFSVMWSDYERAEIGDINIDHIAKFGWLFDDEWTPKPLKDTTAYRNKMSYYKNN